MSMSNSVTHHNGKKHCTELHAHVQTLEHLKGIVKATEAQKSEEGDVPWQRIRLSVSIEVTIFKFEYYPARTKTASH